MNKDTISAQPKQQPFFTIRDQLYAVGGVVKD